MNVQHNGVSEKIPKTEGHTPKDVAENDKANNQTEDGQKKDKKSGSKAGELENEDGKRKNDDSMAQNVEPVGVLKCDFYGRQNLILPSMKNNLF